MGILRLPTATRNQLVEQIQALIDLGASAGVLEFYDGTQPDTADTAITAQTLLATLTFGDPSAPSPTAGVLTFGAIVEDSSGDAGTITWARIKDSGGNTIFDCDVTLSGGGGTIEMNTLIIGAGNSVRLTSFTVTMPSEVA